MAKPTEASPESHDGSSPPVHESDFRDLSDFRYALRLFLRFSEEQARAAGITPQQHLLLLAVRGHGAYPEVTIADVAERLQVRHHSASRLVERGVQRGLLERRVDPVDRRKVRVALTTEGERLLTEITRANKRELRALENQLFGESLRLALHAYNSGQ
jgi:DNA-binding MarR family transcriptional regulator